MVASLSVIIVNWRQEHQTLRCVAAFRRWKTFKPELFVVDNESSEKSREALTNELDANELIRGHTNLGYAGGNNLGIARALHSGTPFVLLMNNDAAIEETDMIRLIDRLQENPRVAIIGPVLHESRECGVQLYVGGNDIANNVLTRKTAELHDLPCMPGYPLNDVDYVPGTVFLTRRNAFEQIGYLDEDYFFSGEIADFCKRARDGGYRVCVDLESEAQHDASKTPHAVRETLYVYYSLRNRFLYAKKHYPLEKAKYLVRWSSLCIVEFCRALATGKLRKARAILLALAHGGTGRFGNRNAAFL
jgi:GT2 family glycosyltransferase